MPGAAGRAGAGLAALMRLLSWLVILLLAPVAYGIGLALIARDLWRRRR